MGKWALVEENDSTNLMSNSHMDGTNEISYLQFDSLELEQHYEGELYRTDWFLTGDGKKLYFDHRPLSHIPWEVEELTDSTLVLIGDDHRLRYARLTE